MCEKKPQGGTRPKLFPKSLCGSHVAPLMVPSLPTSTHSQKNFFNFVSNVVKPGPPREYGFVLS